MRAVPKAPDGARMTAHAMTASPTRAALADAGPMTAAAATSAGRMTGVPATAEAEIAGRPDDPAPAVPVAGGLRRAAVTAGQLAAPVMTHRARPEASAVPGARLDHAARRTADRGIVTPAAAARAAGRAAASGPAVPGRAARLAARPGRAGPEAQASDPGAPTAAGRGRCAR